MVKNISAALLIAAAVAAPVSAPAQQQLRVFILDRIGPTELDRDGYGCFDPLAALRFDEDVTGGEVSATTENAFAVGSCVILESGSALEGAQRISIKNQTFVRGAVAGGAITAYLPNWSASLTDVDGGYDETRMNVALPVMQVATALRAHVADYERCLSEGDALETRILDFNDRAAQTDSDRDKDSTGSRIVRGGGVAPVFKIYMPHERNRALRVEALQLQQDVDSYWERCESFSEPMTLDKDYLEFFRAAG